MNGLPEPWWAALVVVRRSTDTGGGTMHIDRVQADRALGFLGFVLSFLFVLAIVAFAFGSTTSPPPPPSVTGTHVK
jgi:hypothetical protein